MTNPRAACKVHGSVPHTIVNYFHFNQNQVKLTVKVLVIQNALWTQKSSRGLVQKSVCEVISLHTRYALYAFPLLGQEHKHCASQASHFEVNEENEGLYNFYK